MSQQKSPDRKRRGSKPRSEIPDAPAPSTATSAQSDLLKKVLDDTAFNAIYVPWSRTARTGAWNGGLLATAEFLEAHRIYYQIRDRGMLEAINAALVRTFALLPSEEVNRLSYLHLQSDDAVINAALQHPGLSSQHEEWKRIADLRHRNIEDAVNEALKNPGFSLRALVHHYHAWTFTQPRIMEFISRLVWLAHHAPKGKNASEAGKLLKQIVLPVRPRGASPELKPEYIRKYFSAELKRVQPVLGGMRLTIREDWQKHFKQHSPVERTRNNQPVAISLNDLLDRAATYHCFTHKTPAVYTDDIRWAVFEDKTDIRAYAVWRTAKQFGVTEKEVREAVRDLR